MEAYRQLNPTSGIVQCDNFIDSGNALLHLSLRQEGEGCYMFLMYVWSLIMSAAAERSPVRQTPPSLW